MRTSSAAIFIRFLSSAFLLLAPVAAAAQSAADEDVQLIKASSLGRYYARYYAPYAIQAAAAYLEVNELDSLHLKRDAEGHGEDVKFVAGQLSSDPTIAARARALFDSWQYQFGSDKPLDCIVPTEACKAAFANRGWDFGSGPAYHVWARKRFPPRDRGACTEVSIAFRGTDPLNRWDWISNANRYYSPYDDYYQQLRRNIDGIISTIRELDCYRLARKKPQIVSTGHSLGGGLAQFVALANKSNGPKIVKVFAFDPSPVTGAHILDSQTRVANAQGLTIDRIYQEGEVLSPLRWAVQEYPSASSTCDPFVRTVKVDAVPGSGSLLMHGMQPLAAKLVALSYDGDDVMKYHAPQSPAKCTLRYAPPANTDDDVPLEIADGQQATRYARRREPVTVQFVRSARNGTQLDRARGRMVTIRANGHKLRKVHIVNL